LLIETLLMPQAITFHTFQHTRSQQQQHNEVLQKKHGASMNHDEHLQQQRIVAGSRTFNQPTTNQF